MSKRVLQFGIFKPQYIRNAVLKKGFEENGFEVTQIAVDPSVGSLKKFWHLYTAYKALPEKDFDLVIVAYPGHTVVWLARLLFGKKIIFDAFLSLYDANVFDRKFYRPWSVLGIRDWFYDWHACMLAHKVLLPEDVHVKCFVETFGIPREKFIRIYTGANDDVFKPQPQVQKLDAFTVHFHGNFIPLQGIEYIIDAAYELKDENVHFQIVGSGGELYESINKKIKDLKLTNVDMLGHKPLEEVPEYIARSQVCLGVFGDTHKTKRVISNKIYECLAVGMPVITSRTPATEELFVDGENVLFAEVADGKDIAQKIMQLKRDAELREKLGREARIFFEQHLTPKQLVGGLLEKLTR